MRWKGSRHWLLRSANSLIGNMHQNDAQIAGALG